MAPETAPQNSGLARRNLMTVASAGFAALGATSLLTGTNAKAQTMTSEWDKVFPRSNNIVSAVPAPFLREDGMTER